MMYVQIFQADLLWMDNERLQCFLKGAEQKTSWRNADLRAAGAGAGTPEMEGKKRRHITADNRQYPL